MARYIGPVCRLCRREGTKLMLKGARCLSEKCALVQRKNTPGEVSKKRKAKLSEYGTQLREKQKIKRYYNVLEKQFKLYYEKASRKTGITGENLLKMLETRLDNIIFIMNIASSKRQSRQLILHGHITVNGKRVDKPAFPCKAGDHIAVKEKSKRIRTILENLKELNKQALPSWLEVDENKVEGKIINMPERSEIQVPGNEQLVVELYSK